MFIQIYKVDTIMYVYHKYYVNIINRLTPLPLLRSV